MQTTAWEPNGQAGLYDDLIKIKAARKAEQVRRRLGYGRAQGIGEHNTGTGRQPKGTASWLKASPNAFSSSHSLRASAYRVPNPNTTFDNHTEP